jgi:hypothetical protein
LASATAQPIPSPDSQLRGQYAATGEHVCLWATNGFDSNNQPKLPTVSFSSSTSIEGTVTFNGDGTGTLDVTDVNISTIPAFLNPPAPPILLTIPPSVSSDQVSGSLSYEVTSRSTFTATAVDLTGVFLTGPFAGQSFALNKIVLSGKIATDHKSLSLTSIEPTVETVTGGTGGTRSCHRSLVLFRITQSE